MMKALEVCSIPLSWLSNVLVCRLWHWTRPGLRPEWWFPRQSTYSNHLHCAPAPSLQEQKKNTPLSLCCHPRTILIYYASSRFWPASFRGFNVEEKNRGKFDAGTSVRFSAGTHTALPASLSSASSRIEWLACTYPEQKFPMHTHDTHQCWPSSCHMPSCWQSLVNYALYRCIDHWVLQTSWTLKWRRSVEGTAITIFWTDVNIYKKINFHIVPCWTRITMKRARNSL